MREILFRGQTRRYGEKVRMGDGAKMPSRWVYGGVLQGRGSHSIIYGGENENDPSDGLDKWVVYTDTLGQFTGLTDKDGKKIFDGDILKITWSVQGREPVSEKCAVVYSKGGFFMEHDSQLCGQVSNYACSCGGVTVEVIGDIHDNPELLEV